MDAVLSFLQIPEKLYLSKTMSTSSLRQLALPPNHEAEVQKQISPETVNNIPEKYQKSLPGDTPAKKVTISDNNNYNSVSKTPLGRGY